ncbi:MAG: hypothetical protein ACOC9P_01865, partial [bacterium]
MRTCFILLFLFLFAPLTATAEPPHYSQKDYYPVAPQAKDLPRDPNEMRREHPGLYENVRNGIVFHGGFHFALAPDQPVVELPHKTWAIPKDRDRPLTIVALYLTGPYSADLFDFGERLGAQVKGVPLPFTRTKNRKGTQFTERAMQRLRAALDGPVDLIMINRQIQTVPEEFREAFQSLILEKVKSGTGLLAVGPLPGDGPLIEKLPVENAGQSQDNTLHDYRRAEAGDSWLTAGVAFDLWPGQD